MKRHLQISRSDITRSSSGERNREPVAYISGFQEFWGLSFEVSPAVLIPRPETELIVEVFIEYFPGRNEAMRRGRRLHGQRLSGGGHCPRASGGAGRRDRHLGRRTGVARRNADRHHVGDRISFLKDDVLSQVAGGFDAIVSNPPYVPDDEVDTLQPEVRRHEPRMALAAGADGLDVVRTLVTQSAARLKPSGLLLFEFGFGQAACRDPTGGRHTRLDADRPPP